MPSLSPRWLSFPFFVTRQFQVTQSFSQFFGGTGLLIIVGVALDTLQQLESQLMTRHYEGFMKGGGKIRGRRQWRREPPEVKEWKVRASVGKRCSECKIIRRNGIVRVICKRNPRHKQRQG